MYTIHLLLNNLQYLAYSFLPFMFLAGFYNFSRVKNFTAFLNVFGELSLVWVIGVPLNFIISMSLVPASFMVEGNSNFWFFNLFSLFTLCLAVSLLLFVENNYQFSTIRWLAFCQKTVFLLYGIAAIAAIFSQFTSVVNCLPETNNDSEIAFSVTKGEVKFAKGLAAQAGTTFVVAPAFLGALKTTLPFVKTTGGKIALTMATGFSIVGAGQIIKDNSRMIRQIPELDVFNKPSGDWQPPSPNSVRTGGPFSPVEPSAFDSSEILQHITANSVPWLIVLIVTSLALLTYVLALLLLTTYKKEAISLKFLEKYFTTRAIDFFEKKINAASSLRIYFVFFFLFLLYVLQILALILLLQINYVL